MKEMTCDTHDLRVISLKSVSCERYGGRLVCRSKTFKKTLVFVNARRWLRDLWIVEELAVSVHGDIFDRNDAPSNLQTVFNSENLNRKIRTFEYERSRQHLCRLKEPSPKPVQQISISTLRHLLLLLAS